MFLQPDLGTFLFQLINFAIFFALLNVVFLRPVGEAIRKRRQHIETVQADYERYSRQVNGYRTDADAKRAAARREAEEAVAKARSDAEAKAAAMLAEKTAEAQKIADAARATVASEVEAAKGREDSLAATLAQSLLARATGTSK
jgi:F0F1-type ATP synthase membrane subunit b/b'